MKKALGGMLVGASLALIAVLHAPWLSELRNFHGVLLEYLYEALGPVAPLPVMRALSTFAGQTLLLTLLGGLLGLAGSVSATLGILVFLFGILWARIVFFHASTQRMISWEGLAALAASAAAALIGVAAFRLGRLLRRIPLAKGWLPAGVSALLAGCFLLMCAQGVAGTARPSAAAPSIRRVVLLGTDGATWDVALPMIREGRLPHLARLMREGSWGDIRTTLPWKSPILWTTIATGKREQEHGIHDFVVRRQEDREILPVSVSSRKVKAIWEMAGQAGRRVGVVGWYGSWPAEPVNGVMVSNRLILRELPDRVYPPERTAEFDALLGHLPESDAPSDEQAVTQAGLRLWQEERPELFLLYLREVDDMQHFFWKQYAWHRGSRLGRWIHGPAPTDGSAEADARRIETAYERTDAALGEILRQAGPETAVVVVSDHGGGIKGRGERNFTLNPVLQRMGLPVVDSTRNARYEERQLFVKGDKEEERILLSALGKLGQIKTSSGQPLVTRAFLRRSSPEGMHACVFLNIHLKESETLSGEGFTLPVSEVVRDNHLTGGHRMHGILVMAGPGIRAGGRLRAASVLDVTPTLLYLLNLPVAEDMAGRVLLEAMEPDFRKSRPVRTVPTYETQGPRSVQGEAKSSADGKVLNQLRALGYIQ